MIVPSSFRLTGPRAFFLLLASFFVAGCGFHPIYGSRTGKPEVMAELNNVEIENIADRHGQILRNDLIDLMYTQGRPQSPKYHLAIKIKGAEENLGILQDAVTTLTELTLTATYTLIDQNGRPLVTATAHSVSSFSQIPEQYATLAGENDAYQRTLNEVSIQIVNRLSLYFSEGAITPSAPATPPATPPNAMPAAAPTPSPTVAPPPP
jgi:LPS-assembly lipoprotein